MKQNVQLLSQTLATRFRESKAAPTVRPDFNFVIVNSEKGTSKMIVEDTNAHQKHFNQKIEILLSTYPKKENYFLFCLRFCCMDGKKKFVGIM